MYIRMFSYPLFCNDLLDFIRHCENVWGHVLQLYSGEITEKLRKRVHCASKVYIVAHIDGDRYQWSINEVCSLPVLEITEKSYDLRGEIHRMNTQLCHMSK